MKRFENVTKLSIDQYVSRRESLHLPSVGHKGSFHVLSGSTDGDIRMWGLQDGNCYVIFSGHTGPITALSSMWSAKVVISGSEDCSVCLWDVNSESGHKVSSFHRYIIDLDVIIVDSLLSHILFRRPCAITLSM